MYTFVYGTLRPGYGMHTLIKPAVSELIENCTTPGTLYVSGLPYADFDGDGTVVGTLFKVDKHDPRVERVADIETGAGYRARNVPVTTPDGRVIHALAWHYPYKTRVYANLNARVPSGDYRDVNRSFVQS